MSTQIVQYDKIGLKYNSMHDLPAVQPEQPSTIAALGDIKGSKCLDLACGTGRYTHLLHSLGAASVTGYDISTTMIEGAKASYPTTEYPTMHFSVADCAEPLPCPPEGPYDIIFAGWFLNYAGTTGELTSMFKNIAQNLAPSGRFVGITTNGHDKLMQEPKMDFYGLDILVLEKEYQEPASDEVLGIKARVRAHTEYPIEFDVFEFFHGVYERCAKEAGLELTWSEPIVPNDERKESDYWDLFLSRPTFYIVEATKSSTEA